MTDREANSLADKKTKDSITTYQNLTVARQVPLQQFLMTHHSVMVTRGTVERAERVMTGIVCGRRTDPVAAGRRYSVPPRTDMIGRWWCPL